MPADLLFEIGCEEIPAKMLARALETLPDAVTARLDGARLAHGPVRVMGTPRRLAVIVKGLADRQPDIAEEVVGPPVSAAFGPDGAVTKAGQGFAAKAGVDPASLTKKEVPGKKGLYAVAIRNLAGRDTRSLLPEMLRELAASIAWPKSQRWGWGMTAFVRPVQWLVALYGGEVVPVAWADLTAGRTTRGHRFLSRGGVEIATPADYVEALRAANVVVDPEARQELVRAELARLEQETGLRVRPDEALLAEVIHLGEYPVGLCGRFDASYLEVPEEVIVTAMRTHQRYFAMEDAGGKLANRFATMMATVVKDPAVVQRGNEYVIAARLSDAKFFFAEDRKGSFEEWNGKLASVVFQAKLGERARTIGHKVRRIEDLAARLAAGVAHDREVLETAARFCKADLASSAVGEFPELQGVMGRHYALAFGYSEAIARVIEEHWLPKGQASELPRSVEGALIAIADRMDTLVGCFATGLQPSGSADPLGLRRAAIGVLSILLERGFGGPRMTPEFPRDVRTLIHKAAASYGDALALSPEAEKQLQEFMVSRLRGLLIDQGLPAQDVEVVLAKHPYDPSDVLARARAVGRVPATAREVFKRIANILDDARAKQLEVEGAVDASLFASPDGVEARLWNAFALQRARIDAARSTQQYAECFEILAGLAPHVAAFFDRGGVMVMDPNPELRANRLRLLHNIHADFAPIADFRKLVAAAS
jgi:glycyl-tRNA synthetase beta chain